MDNRTIARMRSKLFYAKLNVFDRISRGHDELLPEWVTWDNKSSDELRRTGDQHVAFFKTACGLQTDAHVLDIGCGIGRIAVALTKYLTNKGSYKGVDIVPEAINWCTRKITSRCPHFRFYYANVYNSEYNPKGLLKASDYTFPFNDESFDFVALSSVFTHMLPQDLERYLFEIARLLKPGGTCFASYFLLNRETLERVDAGKSTLDFKCKGDGFRTISQDVPERATAYAEERIKRLYEQNGLAIALIRYGTWSAHPTDFEYQDFVVANKIEL